MNSNTNSLSPRQDVVEFLRLLNRKQLSESIVKYTEYFNASDWPSPFDEYREPSHWLYRESGGSQDFWGRLLIAIAFHFKMNRPLPHKDLGGLDGEIKKALVREGLIAYPIKEAISLPTKIDGQFSYKEGMRGRGERNYFIRHPELAKLVKQNSGYTCAACGLKGEDQYAEFGERAIEAHHLIAFCDRSRGGHPIQETSLKDMAALCANCHRIIHSTSPAMTIKELQQLLRRPTQPSPKRP